MLVGYMRYIKYVRYNSNIRNYFTASVKRNNEYMFLNVKPTVNTLLIFLYNPPISTIKSSTVC